jgi:hypothetical protein
VAAGRNKPLQRGRITAASLTIRRGPDSPAGQHYLLAGLLRCSACGRLLESCWSNGEPGYRCHGHTTASRLDPARPRNACVREDQILTHLPALGILVRAPARSGRKPGREHSPATAGAAHLSYLRVKAITLTYDPDEHTLRAGTHGP